LLFTTLLIDNKAKEILTFKLKTSLEDIKQYRDNLIIVID